LCLARAGHSDFDGFAAQYSQDILDRKMNRRCLIRLWSDDAGEDIAEYAVMLAVVLVIVLSTVRLIGANASTVFSQVGSSIQ
jgi:Flp pilus assembly pilin Flp